MAHPAMDEAMQGIIERAQARAKAKKAARADPLAAKPIENTPARNPYSVTIQYKPDLKFAPKKHQQRDSTAYTTTNTLVCLKLQTTCDINISHRLGHQLNNSLIQF